ncbi:M3 family metallopeptidase [Arenimonas sp.]|uniref:M3 family metallopeptidase n=1 Tax=Arenimonas sp. TaxID=1872635 RepID=UPI0039E319A6
MSPTSTLPASNPFFADSTLPLHYPAFDKIKDSDFAPAFDYGMKEQLAEVKAIADNPAKPTFDNTIVAMEKSGFTLGRALSVFFNLVGTDTNPARDKIQSDYSARFAAHQDAISLDPKLFARIKALYDARATAGYDAEDLRLVEKYYDNFVRSGALLSAADQAKLKQMNAELAELGTQFSQNVLAEVNDSAVIVDDKAELDGLSEDQIATAAKAAENAIAAAAKALAAAQEADRAGSTDQTRKALAKAQAAQDRAAGMKGKYLLKLNNFSNPAILPHLNNRALRERVMAASLARGSRGNAYDNTAIVSRVMSLRAEEAKMLGYPNYAAYGLGNQTAKTPEAVNAMLGKLAPAAVANARKEAADIQALIDREQKAKGQPSFALQPWDWAYYTEKVRQERYNFDESQLKPYLELDHVQQDGVFYAANQLYGLSFKERKDLPVYHPDVRVFDVFDRDGKQLAIFISDMYARDSKRGGAWMNTYVDQSAMTGFLPVVANHLNIPKPADGQPTLLTWDEVTTMFHEFGHALHGMFSNVKYPYFTGTSVPRDFVEYPSQVNEMWADWPSVLANYAKHYQTGAPMPKELLDKVLASSKFNQGFTTTEYLGAAMLDQRWHQLPASQVPGASGVMAFEAQALAKDGIDFPAVPPRYRTPYFSHIMGGYAAGYYAYIWSEVLDADSVEWFKQNGGLKRENGDHFRATLLSRGGSADAMKLFRDFAGRDPNVEPLLKRRGLDGGTKK